MGGGTWTTDTYADRAATKKAAGKSTFDYHDTVRSTGRWDAHPDLDPKKLNTEGRLVRESRDSADHPNSTAIAVFFDVTGSMHGIPVVLQQKLPQLLGLLQRKGYVEDPQILFGAIGDAYDDRIPLQLGQFESDNRMDEALENLVLEGGGGGGNHESYQLAAYFLARHTELDCFEKRGKKGYAFFIGDERVYAKIERHQVEELIGDGLQEDLTTEEVFRELQEKFHVFFLFAVEGSYREEQVLYEGGGDQGDSIRPTRYWRDLLGQNAITLDDASAVCETIALTLGLMEGISLDEGVEHLKEIGVDHRIASSVSKALEPVGAVAGASVVATSSGGSLDLDGSEDTTRRIN